MRNLKFSFALVVALLAVGLTVATKASNIGKRAITACFENVVLQNVSGASEFDVLDFLSDNPTATCQDVKDEYVINSRVWLKSSAGLISRTGCTPTNNKYCCIEFDIQTTSPGGTVPQLTVGSQTGYFFVHRVLCKLN